MNLILADGTTLIASVSTTDGGVLIATAYDGSGRQAGVKTLVIAAGAREQPTDTGLAVVAGYTYRLMLVSAATWAPLCQAWSTGG